MVKRGAAAPRGAERDLLALERAADESDAALSAALRAALESAHARVVWRAAELVRARSVEGLERGLCDAFARLVPDGPKSDPGCRAKLAIVEALDAAEWGDEQPFVDAARLVQREPSWGEPVDTAVNVRARGVLALARQGWVDLPLLAAELLRDPEVPVRAAAADALAAFGRRDAAGALIGADSGRTLRRRLRRRRSSARRRRAAA